MQVAFSSLPEDYYEQLKPIEIKLLKQICTSIELEKTLYDLHDFMIFFVKDATKEQKHFL